jgi:hypothetical protein
MLTFDTLREANRKRLPQFKNCHGELAHSKPDGSDWSPAQWFQAVIGEIGEWARCRVQYEKGEIDFLTYRTRSGKELADIATYLDILAQRCNDEVNNDEGFGDHAQCLMEAMAYIGEYANSRKKFDRGDISAQTLLVDAKSTLPHARVILADLQAVSPNAVIPHKVTQTNVGASLTNEIIDKFNEVSHRVNADVFISELGHCYTRNITP